MFQMQYPKFVIFTGNLVVYWNHSLMYSRSGFDACGVEVEL